MLDLLRTNKSVQKVWLAQVLSYIGDWAAVIALSGLILDETRSLALSVLPAVAITVGMMVGTYYASIGDRYQRNTVLASCDAIRVLLFGLLAVLHLSLPAITIILVLSGMVSSIFGGARAAIWQDIVDPTQVQNARSLSLATTALTMALGSAIGTSLWQSLGARQALLFDAITFAFSAVLLFKMQLPHASLDDKASLTDRHSSWTVLRHSAYIKAVVVIILPGALAANAIERLYVAYAHEQLRNIDAMFLATATALSIFVSIIVISKYVIPRFGAAGQENQQTTRRLRWGLSLQAGSYVLALLAFYWPGHLIGAVVGFSFIGASFSYAPLIQPAVAQLVPRNSQAAVFATLEALGQISVLVGSLLAAAAISKIGVLQTVQVGLAASIIYLLLYRYWFESRTLKQL